jgi:hypothetical protein
MHPLSRYLVPAGIILVGAGIIWFILAPLIGYLAQFWPLLAIAVGIGLLIWRFGFAQAQAIIKGTMDTLALQPLYGIIVGALLTAIYGGAVWLGYLYLAPWLTESLLIGHDQRWSWVLVTALGLSLIPGFWRLYQVTGIPGDPDNVRRGIRTIQFFVLIFFAYLYYSQPNWFFDHKTGEPRFWVADKEGRVYPAPGYSPETGEKLRPGTQKDVERFKRAPWPERIWQKTKQQALAAAPRGPRLNPDGTVAPWEKINLSPGEEKAYFFQKDGFRVTGKGGRVRVISASNAPTLVDVFTDGQRKAFMTIDVDRDTRQSPPWVTSNDKFGVRFVAETAVTIQAR